MPLPLLIAFFILFPALAIYLCYRFPVINKLGVVILCYVVGMIAGNVGIISADAMPVQSGLAGAAVALALPLLFFSIDVKKWLRLAGKSILCMGLAVLAIFLTVTGAYFIIRNGDGEAWKLTGMAVGVYTGGTPNLAAIKAALDVSNDTFIVMHTYDTVISLIYILFCATIAQRIFNRLLPAFNWVAYSNGAMTENNLETEDIHSYSGMLTRKTAGPLLAALALSGIIVALSDRASILVPKDHATAVTILLITTLGIGSSFIARVRNIEKTFQMGMYIIYIFCLAVGSMANVRILVNINWELMLFIITCIFGSMLIHAVLCRIFSIDTDTFIITSVSAICSPPFVPPVAEGLKNRAVLLSGVITGIIGYALGNYLGISVAYVIRYIFH